MKPRATDRAIATLVAPGGMIAAAGFGLIALLVAADIALRNLGILGWPWLNEVTEYLLTISTFLGAPWVLHHGGHVNVDILLRVVPPAVARATVRLAYAVGLVICAACLWIAASALLDIRSTGAQVFKNLVFPEWWLMVPMVWCFGLCTLEFAVRLFGPVRPT